tara:strand:+ start:112 stop:744 length:633 start_codon:yes stop_codon:yes gene_type:complete
MINNSIKISVIVTNYNYSKFITRCLRSLLNQEIDRKIYEIIVVDDYSTDNSVNVLQSYVDNKEIKLIINEKNEGIGYSSKIGVDNSRGKYFVRVDADDFVQPAFLPMLYNFLKFNPDYVGVSSDYFITNNDEKILERKKFILESIACGLMLRTSYLEQIGSYNSTKRIFEDQDLFARINKSKIFNLPVPLYNYVKHNESTTFINKLNANN